MVARRSILAPCFLLAAVVALMEGVAFTSLTLPNREPSRVGMSAEAPEEPAKKAAKKAWVGPKKGSQVRVLRPESYWFQQRGTVVNVNQKTNIKYPVTVKFDFVNYANVNTNGFALWEVDELKEGEYDPDLP
mmetsp:Transcript_5455/g.13199  ORF Transcript_5455/g.13199 Transcript_5455/m.13199 type:complete len:132 (-) Transcript_5455:82-477(-)